MPSSVKIGATVILRMKCYEYGRRVCSKTFIGAKPYAEWRHNSVIKNERGFIEAVRDLQRYDAYSKVWKLERQPYLLETCALGIFAAGDVRAGAMNRVASAVGEGSMAIK